MASDDLSELKFWKGYFLDRVDEIEPMLSSPWGFICASIVIEMLARLVNGVGKGKLTRQQYEAFIEDWLVDYGSKSEKPFKFKLEVVRPGQAPEAKYLPTQIYCIMRSSMVHNYSLLAGESEIRSGATDYAIFPVNRKQAKKLGLKHLQGFSRPAISGDNSDRCPAIEDAVVIVGEKLLDDIRIAVKLLFRVAKEDDQLRANIFRHLEDRTPVQLL